MIDALNHRVALARMLFDLAGLTLVVASLLNADLPGSASQGDDISKWKNFSNRAGWQITYPPTWHIGSCRQCDDPADPNVIVTLSDSWSNVMVIIEHFIDKPAGQTVDSWLHDIARHSVLNEQVSQQWTALRGVKALKVINRNPDSTESENIYLMHGSKTFAIRTGRLSPPHELCQRILSTFRFTTSK